MCPDTLLADPLAIRLEKIIPDGYSLELVVRATRAQAECSRWRAEGEAIGRHRVRRVMRGQGVWAIQPRRLVPHTTDSRHGQRMSPKRLRERGLQPQGPGEVVVGEITCLLLQGGKWASLETYSGFLSHLAGALSKRP